MVGENESVGNLTMVRPKVLDVMMMLMMMKVFKIKQHMRMHVVSLVLEESHFYMHWTNIVFSSDAELVHEGPWLRLWHSKTHCQRC